MERTLLDRLFESRHFFNSNKKQSASQNLEAVNKLISEKKYKKALIAIESSIEKGITSNQLLFKKASLLSQSKQHEAADAVWQKLARQKNKPKLASLAEKYIKISKKNQLEHKNNLTKLISSLYKIAGKYHWKIKQIPEPNNFSLEIDLPQLIRKEAALARQAELPKLSFDLITTSMKAGHSSTWLIHDRALSLSMLRQHEKALKSLEKLIQDIKNPKLQNSIKQSIDALKKNPKDQSIKTKIYMAKQAKQFALSSKSEEKFLINLETIDKKTDVKFLIIKAARACLKEEPETSLKLTNSILDYFPKNAPALQLKGEALEALNRTDKALQSWLKIAYTDNKKVAEKACQSISILLARQAQSIRKKTSPQMAISFFIRQHLERKLTPTLIPELKSVLQQLEPSNKEFFTEEIEHNHYQLLFNEILIEYLEDQLNMRDRLNTSTPSQKISAISETAKKAG